MNMKTFSIGVVVLALMVATYFVMSQPATEPVQPATTAPTTSISTSLETIATTSESNTTSVDPAEIELDLSKLQGKDRLYTEEEGKYENLSEEERDLLEKVRCPGQSFTFDSSGRKKDVTRPCDEVQRNVEDFFRLVTLKNNIAVAVEPPDGMNSGWIHIYDIKSDTRIEIIMGHNYVFGPEYIVRTRPRYLFEGSKYNDYNAVALDFYRPGMTDFVPVPNSELTAGQTYFGVVGIEYTKFTDKFPIKFSGNVITAEVSRISCDETETGYPINCVKTYIETKTLIVPSLS